MIITERERDGRIEQNRRYAVERFVFLISRLRNLPPEICRQSVLISSEVEENVRHTSSVARELEFLHSQTIHHHAIVAEKLNSFGIKISADFGVAPSTLKFWKAKLTKFVAGFKAFISADSIFAPTRSLI